MRCFLDNFFCLYLAHFSCCTLRPRTWRTTLTRIAQNCMHYDPLPNAVHIAIWMPACIVWLYYVSSSTMRWFRTIFFCLVCGLLEKKKKCDRSWSTWQCTIVFGSILLYLSQRNGLDLMLLFQRILDVTGHSLSFQSCCRTPPTASMPAVVHTCMKWETHHWGKIWS